MVFLTNDIVRLHPDFKFIGRTDFQFQSGSKLINPQFIESELIKSGLVGEALLFVLKKMHGLVIPVAYVSKQTSINFDIFRKHICRFFTAKSFKFFPDDIHPTDPNFRHRLL